MVHKIPTLEKLQTVPAHTWIWSFFFISPFLWVATYLPEITTYALYFATALLAAAFAWKPSLPKRTNHTFSPSHLFLLLCMMPTVILLLQQKLPIPWSAFIGLLSLTASWIIYQSSQISAVKILASKHFMLLITITAYLYILYALIQAWDLRFFDSERLFPVWSGLTADFTGPLLQRNFEGLFQVLATTIILFHASKQTRPLLLIVAIIPMMGVLLTNSRSSILLLLLVCFLFAFLYRNKRFFLSAFALSFSTAFLLTLLVNYVGIIESNAISSNHLTSPFQRFSSGGIEDRLAIWSIAIDLIREHPILGIGWQNMPAYAVDSSLRIIQESPSLANAISSVTHIANSFSHNVILEFTMSFGIMGLAAIGIIIYHFWSQRTLMPYGLCHHQATSLGNLLALIIFLHSMVSVSITQPFFMILFAFFLAAGTAKEHVT